MKFVAFLVCAFARYQFLLEYLFEYIIEQL